MTDWEGCRWDGRAGHYESWFQRANHPHRPLALWLRHTIFCPAGNPDAAQGELWAIWFDGERGRNVVAKTEVPMRDCSFASTGMEVRLPGAQLSGRHVEGGAGRLKWKLDWQGGDELSLLYQPSFYPGGFPKAKALTVNPNARFEGTFEVDGETHAIDGWQGSHNHNWGSRHTDVYAWFQVNGFDNAPDVFIEGGTGKAALAGPILSPRLGVAVLNVEGRRYALNGKAAMIGSRGRAEGFQMDLSIRQDGVEVDVSVAAPKERIVALRYRNPPGGVKACLNSKLAGCTVKVREDGKTRTFSSANRAAFEILCDENDPRVPTVGGFAA